MVLLLRFLNGPAIYAPWRQWGMYSLDRKVAIVTGASEGIGAELARLLRSKGCRLVLAARNEAKLRAVAGPDSCVVPGDLTGETVRVRVIEAALERFGRIDILINNAGRGHYGSASTTPLGEARDLFELNVFAPFHLAQRIELRRYGVRVMSVFPGYVNTAFQDHAAGAPPPPGIVKGRRFAISAQGCAAAIVSGLEHGRNTVVTPRSGWLLVWFNRLFPGLVESSMETA
jgi:short-subunit dehydrogenase